jgi:DNA-binding GntR family transcriptional regulator
MLGDQAYREIRSLIASGDLLPGTRTLEVELARRLSISRTPVREALQRLEGDGVLERSSGTLVVAELDGDHAYELYLLRELVEPDVAQYSAPLLTATDIAQLKAYATAMTEAVSPVESAELNTAFHDTLYSRCPYRSLLAVVNDARERMITYRLFATYDREEQVRSTAEHHRIAEVAAGVRAGRADPDELGSAIREHIKAARLAFAKNNANLCITEPSK